MAGTRVICFAALLLAACGLRAPSSASSMEGDAKLEETVRALDTNGNGKIDLSELEAFAKTQGLSEEEAIADFKDLDKNHDGALDVSEIGPLFNGADPSPDDLESPATVQAPAKAAEKTALSAPASGLEKASAPQVATPKEAVEPSVGTVSQVQAASDVSLDLAALQRDAEKQAGGVIASRLAQRAQKLLAQSAADEQKAKAFDAQVRALRGNATALAQDAGAQTQEAALAASAAVTERTQAKLQEMNLDEHKVEAEAQKRREEAKKAMDRVHQAQAALRGNSA